MASNPLNRSGRLQILIKQLRQYKPTSSSTSPGGEDSDDAGDRRKVSSATCAVLVCLFEGSLGELRVILTKRSSKLALHSGEVALPGGKAEKGDADETETALREAKEEIGLDPSLVTVVTVLEPVLSMHLLKVVPVIGILSDRQAFRPTVNAAEVEVIFDAPLEMFLKDENRRSEELEWMGTKYIIHFFDFKTKDKTFVIWGLTAGILIHAASVVYKRRPAFPYKYPKFQSPGTLNRERSRI